MRQEPEVIDVADIEDSVNEAERLLKQCTYLMQEVNENYFDKHDRQDKESHTCIVWDFERYGTFTDVVSGKLHELFLVMEDIRNSIK